MWIILTLLCAFLTATSASLSKIILKRNDEYFVGWLRLIVSAPFLLCILFWIDVPKLDATFFRTVLILIPLDIAAYFLYIKAIKHSPLSLTLPFLALTPVFLILSGRFILQESINPIGICGISLVAMGAYLLNIETFHLGILEPVRAIFREKGSVYMIIVAFIFSFTSALGKLAIGHSSVLFFSAVYFPVLSVILIPLVIIRYKQGVLSTSVIRKDRWFLLLLAVIFALAIITHSWAISMAKVAYMISVKRLSLLFGVIYGWIVFKERHILNRMAGTALMVLGVVLVSLA